MMFSDTTEIPIEDLGPLSMDELRKIRYFWRAANYLSLGQMFLQNNPLLRTRLSVDDVKQDIFHSWGTAPGINLIYAHLNRVQRKYSDFDMLLISGPGHGCSALIANSYLDGTYSELYPEVTQDSEGLIRLFKRFSYRTYSSDAPSIPGTIQAGFELGHSLAHAFGAVLDNRNLIACCIIGDGEAETGSISAAWSGHSFLDVTVDGSVLPVIHLNGYKTDAPSLLSRMSHERLISLFEGLGYEPRIVEGGNPEEVHQVMARAMDSSIEQIIQNRRSSYAEFRHALRWPLILMKTPKGWTGPKVLEDGAFENTALDLRFKKFHPNSSQPDLSILEKWLHSYNIGLLFDKQGKLQSEWTSTIPPRGRRLSESAYCNGGRLRKDLDLPVISSFSDSLSNGDEMVRALAIYVRDVLELNKDNFRVFGSDGTNSGEHFREILSATTRSPAGINSRHSEGNRPARLMEILSQDTAHGWLEGYVLTGRHGLFFVFLQFSILVSSMINQFSRWIAHSAKAHWRLPISSLNIVAVSNQRDQPSAIYHPGFISGLIHQEDDVTNIFLPPDTTSAITTLEACLKSVNSINVILVDVSSANRWLNVDDAVKHCQTGWGHWAWAGSGKQELPDLVFCCAGQSATEETLKAAEKIREVCPELSIRVVNIANLAVLKKTRVDGLTDEQFSNLFPEKAAVVIAYDYFDSDIYSLIAHRQVDLSHWLICGHCRVSAKADQKHSDRCSLARDGLRLLSKIDKSFEAALAKLEDAMHD